MHRSGIMDHISSNSKLPKPFKIRRDLETVTNSELAPIDPSWIHDLTSLFLPLRRSPVLVIKTFAQGLPSITWNVKTDVADDQIVGQSSETGAQNHPPLLCMHAFISRKNIDQLRTRLSARGALGAFLDCSKMEQDFSEI
ncbi:hypothetical protein VNO77_03426 [Canavalia gladiata]|uniref:Uncharacterized protein n=1 Tax=Canavalia gladiata TaxID=3824 RepID=A0AAN9R6V2_CANGL